MQIIDVLVAAGPLSNSIVQVGIGEEDTSFIRTDNNTFVVHAVGNRVIFEAVIDTPIVVDRERILAALLTYNVVWQDTGFVRMALTGNDPKAVAMLIADIVIDDTFTPQWIASVVEDLDGKIQIWRDIIAGGADDESDLLTQENSVRV